ncbi:MAG: ribbon-helix-helix protein, CopG family [Candidatus Bathyarchaeota archaeon]|nr:ribbon-helix-helix protein, CopG family [Candidatus Bathyarchaeota archaeon]
MANPTRITVAFDKSTADLLEKISTEAQLSQSEVMRRALKFYSENKALEDPAIKKKFHAYLAMLPTGEHIIVDVDHWLMFLRLIATSPDKERFWSEHRDVARAHWEQLKNTVHSSEDLLFRLEACNFFRLTKNAPNDFTLVLVSELSKDFIRIFLEEYFEAMGVKAEIKENLTKLRVIIKPASAKIKPFG